VSALTDKPNGTPTGDNTPEAVIAPGAINYLAFEYSSGKYIGIIKNKTGKYRAYYMTVK
jgi:hypothetical protein